MPTSSSKIASSTWKKAFDSLPADSQNALYFLAIYTAPVRKIRIQEFCGGLDVIPDRLKMPLNSRRIIRTHSWHQNKIKAIAEQLERDGWIDVTAESLIHCKNDLREHIVHHLHTTGQYQQLADVLFPHIGGRYFVTHYSEKRSWDRPKHPEDVVRELRHLLITNDAKSLPEVFRYLEQYDSNGDFYRAIHNLFVSFDGFNWLREAKIEFRCLLLQYLLLRTLSQLEYNFDETWDILLETGCDPKCDPVTRVLILDYALCAGKLDDPKLLQFSGQTAPILCGAHKAFVAGRYAEAAEQYRLVLTSFGNLRAVKNAVLPFLSGIFHALAELNVGNRVAVLENAQAAIAKADYVSRGITIAFPMRLEGCWNLTSTIAQRLIGKSPTQLQINTTSGITTRPVWLSVLLSAYESAWFQFPSTLGVETSAEPIIRKATTSFPWIAAEMTDVCSALANGAAVMELYLKTAAEYRKQTGTVPLRDMFTARDEWELWLESLQALANETPKGTKKKTTTKKEQPKARLIWRIEDPGYGTPDFIPYEQKWSARTGSWVEEKEITMFRLFKSQHTLTFLTEQDKVICSKIKVKNNSGYYRGNKTEYFFKEDIALEFVGHPLLFSKPEKMTEQSVRIDLVHARPEISMQEENGKLQVTFSPPLLTYKRSHYFGGSEIEMDDSNKDFFVVRESPTRYKILKLTKTEMRIRSILGEKGRMFPKQAKDRLATLLGKLAGEMSVKTDAAVEFADIPTVPADSKTYLYLAPHGEGIQVDFFVCPLGSGTPNHRPGIGSERILGEVDGKSVQTVRNLKEEQNTRDAIVARFPAFLHGAVQAADQYVFESPGDALSLLAELKDAEREGQPMDFEVYWPQGEKYSVTSTASFGNFSLSFASMEDWLSATGSLKVDGEVLELQKLFELLDDSSDSRFIKLSEQKFLALTNEFRKRLGEFKRLSHAKGKAVQLHPLAAAGMEDFFDAIPSLQKNAIWSDVKKRIEAARDYKAPPPKNFVGDMRDYQLDGYDWLARSAKWGVGCCLADDMGLGKTIQALALLLLRADEGPALVVAPTSVCFNWEREAAKFAPTLKIKRIQSITNGANAKTERDKLIASAKKRDVLITSYTLLQQEIDLFVKKKYATVILDESQAIKNHESNRAKAAFTLQADVRIAMTGTPIENRLTELWSLFRFLNPGLFGSQKSFEDRFAFPIQRDQSASARSTLRRLVHPFILRRTKSQVLEELPLRTEIVREIELSREETALYEAARLNALKELQEIKDKDSGQGQLKILAALTRLRQLCCNPKMVLPNSTVESSKLETFREIMEELKENRHKVLVFSQFVKHLEILKAELDTMGITYQYLDGSTPEKERRKQVDAFQSGASDAFLISIKAGGSGLNLTAADYVIHVDPWWNPAVEDQATDRAHRIGQTRPVTVYRLITQGTIEEKIVRLHHEKRDIADKLLEGTDQATKLSAEELIDILRS